MEFGEADRPRTRLGYALHALVYLGAALLAFGAGQLSEWRTQGSGYFVGGVFILSVFVLRFLVFALVPGMIDSLRARHNRDT